MRVELDITDVKSIVLAEYLLEGVHTKKIPEIVDSMPFNHHNVRFVGDRDSQKRTYFVLTEDEVKRKFKDCTIYDLRNKAFVNGREGYYEYFDLDRWLSEATEADVNRLLAPKDGKRAIRSKGGVEYNIFWFAEWNKDENE